MEQELLANSKKNASKREQTDKCTGIPRPQKKPGYGRILEQ